MKLDLDIKSSGEFEMPVSGSIMLELSDGRPETAQVEGTLTVNQVERRFLLAGTVKAVGKTDCVRCLESFDLEWDVPVDIMVLRDSAVDEAEYEAVIVQQSFGEVDLHEAIRECVVIAFPHAPVCNEGCLGICPNCGINHNLDKCSCDEEDFDPRWEGLP